MIAAINPESGGSWTWVIVWYVFCAIYIGYESWTVHIGNAKGDWHQKLTALLIISTFWPVIIIIAIIIQTTKKAKHEEPDSPS